MAANATAKVTVSLIDRLSAPARIIQNSLRGIRGDMQALSSARLGIGKQFENATARARELRSTLLGIGATGLVAGLGVKRVMKPGTDFETLMVDIRQKADLTSEATKRLGDRIKELGPKVNRGASEIAKGVDFLMGMGMDSENAMGVMPALGKAATTYRAQIEDLAKATFAAFDNMKVPAAGMTKALDVMVTAGKLGGFEIKDMAREFPSLTAAAEALGIKGTAGVAKLSAALQIARKGAADGSEAATNTANLMQKIISPETTKKFAKAGIDIRKELKKTQAAGGDPFVMIAELVKKATKGDLAKLGDFFEDAQVQKFLRPLIANQEEYKRIRDKAGAAEGVVEADFKIRMATFQAVIDRTSQAFERLAVALGDSLVPTLTTLADKLGPIIDGLTSWVSANQQLASAAVLAAGALMGLAGLAAVVKLAGTLMSIVGLKGARGFLNYLAPKGKTGPGAPAPKFGTVETPRPMTPAEIARAGAKFKPPSLTNLSTLKGGAVGALVGILGETVIDKLFDVLPKPSGPAGYDAKAEMNKGFFERLSGLIERSKPTGERPEAHRIDPADYERSRRVQDEMRRDPEGARGRAMMKIDGAREAGGRAGSELGNGLNSALDAAVARAQSKLKAMLADMQNELAAANLTVSITPKMAGAGAALRGIHSDTGIDY